MNIELEEIHAELTQLADEFGLQKPKDLEHYNLDIEEFETMNDLIDEDYKMMSIDNMEENQVDFESLLEEEEELIF